MSLSAFVSFPPFPADEALGPPLPVVTVLAPAAVTVPVPPGAVAGQSISFTYHSLTFSATVPVSLAPGACTGFAVRVSVQAWKAAKKEYARLLREERARKAAARREEEQQRQIRSVLNGLIRELEAPEREARDVVNSLIRELEVREAHAREVRGVVDRLIGSLEREERRELAAARREAQLARKFEYEIRREVERLVSKVVRLVDPRYEGLDEPS